MNPASFENLKADLDKRYRIPEYQRKMEALETFFDVRATPAAKKASATKIERKDVEEPLFRETFRASLRKVFALNVGERITLKSTELRRGEINAKIKCFQTLGAGKGRTHEIISTSEAGTYVIKRLS